MSRRKVKPSTSCCTNMSKNSKCFQQIVHLVFITNVLVQLLLPLSSYGSVSAGLFEKIWHETAKFPVLQKLTHMRSVNLVLMSSESLWRNVRAPSLRAPSAAITEPIPPAVPLKISRRLKFMIIFVPLKRLKFVSNVGATLQSVASVRRHWGWWLSHWQWSPC